MTIASDLLADLEREAALTRKTLAAIPDGKFDFRPHPRSWTLGQLAGHIVDAPSWIPAWREDSMDFAAMGDYQPFTAKTTAELLAGLDRHMAAAREALAGFDDRLMRGTWTARKGDQELMKGRRDEVMRTTLLNHVIQHRGQLQVYLRLCGAIVPPTYGPTADVAEWS